MRTRTIALLLGVLACASCFRAEFLAGTVCERDSDCQPRYICLFPDEVPMPPEREPVGDSTGASDGGVVDGSTTGGPTGVCGSADLTPPPPVTTGVDGDTGSSSSG